MAQAGRDLTIATTAGPLHAVAWSDRGPTLVLVHGTGLLARLWTPLARELAAEFRVIGLDLRGHGDSVKPPSGYDRLSLAGDLIAAIEALGLNRPAILGHSAGATVAALAGGLAPDRVGPLALVEPILQPPGLLGDKLRERGRALAERTARRRPTWPSREAMLADLAAKPTYAKWQSEQLRLYVDEGTVLGEDGAIWLKCPPAIESQLYSTGADLDPWPYLRARRGPVWLIRGSESRTLTPATAEAIATALALPPPITVADAGHFVPQEQPIALLAALEPFWAELRRADPR